MCTFPELGSGSATATVVAPRGVVRTVPRIAVFRTPQARGEGQTPQSRCRSRALGMRRVRRDSRRRGRVPIREDTSPCTAPCLSSYGSPLFPYGRGACRGPLGDL